MFIWFSSGNGRPGIGCCGGTLLLLPLSLFFMSTSDGGLFFLVIFLAAMAVMFILPQMNRTVVPDTEVKRKNDDLFEKPKREEYVLTDDGEIIPSDEDIARYGNFDNGA